jgi:hypothetical protein
MQKIATITPSRSTYPLFGALLAALLLLRSPGSLLHPQFWAEDGTLFFQEAFNRGFLATVAQPASGYLHSFPRLVAGFSLLLPMAQAPLVFNLAAFAVQLIPALYLLNPRMSRLIPSFAGRALAALLYVALPASSETHVNLTNSHWHLTLAAVCILSATPAANPRIKALETFLALLFSLTGPFSILFLPLVAPRLLGVVQGKQPARDQIVALVIAGGAVIQFGFAATSARIGTAAAQSGPLSLQELTTVVSMHTFFNAIFGSNGFTRLYRTLPAIAYGLGLATLGFLLFVAVRDRVKPLLTLFYLAALSIALAFVFPLNDLRLWLHPQAGPRYFLFACVFIVFAVLHLAFAAPSFSVIGRILLAAVVAVGIPADFFHPGQPDAHWADNAAVLRSLPSGADFYVPVVPLYHRGMQLHKRSAQRDPPALSLLQPVASQTPADFSVSRPTKVVLNEASNDTFLGVAGWAIDGAAREPAGGVFVLIDDKEFPAVYGLPKDVDVDGRAYVDCGFSRLIPIDEIGPGPHRVSIAVVTRDGTGSYQPTPPRTFSMNQFFP